MEDLYRSLKYFPAGIHMPVLSYYDAPTRQTSRSSNSDSQDQSDCSDSKPRHSQKRIKLNFESKKNESNSRWPVVDIIEYSTNYIIESEIPGFQKKDILIDFENSNGVLTLQGTWTELKNKKADLAKADNEGALISESSSGDYTVHPTPEREILDEEAKKIVNERRTDRDFKRSFKIKERVDSEKISASLNDGILTINIPKIKSEPKCKIPIS